jgi:hypothetical protein
MLRALNVIEALLDVISQAKFDDVGVVGAAQLTDMTRSAAKFVEDERAALTASQELEDAIDAALEEEIDIE